MSIIDNRQWRNLPSILQVIEYLGVRTPASTAEPTRVQWPWRPVLLFVADHEEDDEVGQQGRIECGFCVEDSGA